MSAYSGHMEAMRQYDRLDRAQRMAQLLAEHADTALSEAGSQPRGQHAVAVSIGLVDALVLELEEALHRYRGIQHELAQVTATMPGDGDAGQVFSWRARPASYAYRLQRP